MNFQSGHRLSRLAALHRDSRIDVGMLLIGGLVATLAMTGLLYLFYPGWLRGPLVMTGALEELLGVHWVLGLVVHVALGTFVFPLILVVLNEVLPGSLPAKGLLLGAILWFAYETVISPVVGGGLFHSQAGGARAVVVFLGAHLLYGGALGAIARSTVPYRAWSLQPRKDTAKRKDRRPARPADHPEAKGA